MKVLKVLIGLAIISVLVIAVFNKIHLDKYVALSKAQNTKISNLEKEGSELKKVVLAARSVSLRHIGKTLMFNGLQKVFEGNEPEKKGKTGNKLILVFSELSCNVCMDKETQFAVELAGKIGPGSVEAIVYANSMRYVKNYIRLNKVNFPVFFCGDNSFFEENDIINTPLLCLVNDLGQVVAAHYPIPGHLEYSEPFHRFCVNYLMNH